MHIKINYAWDWNKTRGPMATWFNLYPLKQWKFNDSKKTLVMDDGFIKVSFKDTKSYEKVRSEITGKKIEKKKTPAKKRKSPAKKKTTTRKRKAPKKSGRILRGKRNSPSTSATSVSVGTKRRGGDGKLYVCKTYKRGNKRVKRWFKV